MYRSIFVNSVKCSHNVCDGVTKIFLTFLIINKTAKYAGLMSDYHFQPIAVESLDSANESAIHFLMVLGKKIAQQTGDERETAFLFLRLSILVQRFNCVLLHDSFVHDDCPD